MKFSTAIYDYKKTGSSSREKFAFGVLAFTSIIMLGIKYEFLPDHAVLNYAVMTGFLIFLGLEIHFAFAKVDHTKKLEGYIEFNVDHIHWNNEKIAWNSINYLSITYSDYEGEFLDPYVDDFGSKRSTGLNNGIFIKMNDSKEYQSNLLIESRTSGRNLNESLWHVVKHNYISYENAKRMVHPKNYKKHQELKKYCKKKTNY